VRSSANVAQTSPSFIIAVVLHWKYRSTEGGQRARKTTDQHNRQQDTRQSGRRQTGPNQRPGHKTPTRRSDLDEIGCRQNGKTCPLVPVMVPRPEEVT
jgi:hypothetical protein